MALQQLSGINIVMFYTVNIFESAGLKGMGNQATVCIGAIQVRGRGVENAQRSINNCNKMYAFWKTAYRWLDCLLLENRSKLSTFSHYVHNSYTNQQH